MAPKTETATALSLEQRAVGAYLGLAIGDALGATVEFLTPREITEKYGIHKKIIGGGWLHLKPGQVTDDTTMALALGESILEQGEINAEAAALAFSEWMRSKPVDIGNTVRRGIVHFRQTGEPSVAENEFDAGNGACMRCLPVALRHYNDSNELLVNASRLQSHVTHNNTVADAGTETVLMMLVSALKGEPKAVLELLELNLCQRFGQFRTNRCIENPSGWIVETLQAVFQAFFQHDNFEDVLVDVVNRGGDADTTGAIAGMLAGAFYGYDGIPKQWLNTLDKDVKIACEQQAQLLTTLAN